MFTEGALRIELHRGSKVIVLDIQADRALIGSGAHCDVRLAPDEAAVEQLMLEAADEQVYARTLTMEPPCLLNGAPFLEGRLPPSSMLELGGVAVCVKFAPRVAPERKKGRSASTPPAVQALGLVGLLVGFYLVLSGPSPDDDPLARSVPPPPLTSAREACPQDDPTAARSLAAEALAAAEIKRERSPFYASDGLRALSHFARAAACYERAGEPALALEARAAESELEQQLSDELHVRHVRLERLLSEERYDAARREGQLLTELVPDRTHPYGQWLSAVIRQGELRLQEGKK